MSKFKMDPSWERKVNSAARSAMKDRASEYQKVFDSLARRYKGRPVSEVKTALKRDWERAGGSMSDADLNDYAKLISEGTPIKMRFK